MIMRIARPTAALVLALALGAAACASGPRTQPTYQTELDALSADCERRGGILAPAGTSTGRPQTDYVCRIAGGGSRIPG